MPALQSSSDFDPPTLSTRKAPFRKPNLIETTLREALLATFDDPGYQPPPLPTVALDIMSLTTQKNVSTRAVVELLERDEMLAGTVMRLVSSSLYAGRTRVATLDDAVVRLGFDTIRDAVFEAALRRGVFQVAEYHETLEQIRRHSVVTAYLTRLVCLRSGVDDDHAFLCGLFHDIGSAALLLAVTHVEAAPPPLDRVWKDLDDLHESAARVVTRCWGLPERLSEIVGHHHHLSTGKDGLLGAAVTVADVLSAEFGANVLGPVGPSGELTSADQVDEFERDAAFSALGLKGKALERIREEASLLVPSVLWI